MRRILWINRWLMFSVAPFVMAVAMVVVTFGDAAPARAASPERGRSTQSATGPLNTSTVTEADGDLTFTLDPGVPYDRTLMQQNLDRAQNENPRLSDTIKQQFEKYPVGISGESTSKWSDFDGTLSMTSSYTGLSLTIVASDVQTSETWLQWAFAQAMGYLTNYLTVLGCLAVFPELVVACPSAGGFTGGLVRGLVIQYFDGTLGEPIALARTFLGALKGALWAYARGSFLQWMEREFPGLLSALGDALKANAWAWAQRAAAWVADVLRDMAEMLPDGIAEWGPPPAAAEVGLKVMPLGDSITFGGGSSTGSGYRSFLHDKLTAQGNSVNFVGSVRAGQMSDNDNEGHPGWTIGDLANITDSSLANYRPNVVLLHIGTNDMNMNVDPAGAPARLGNLIDQIFEAAPQVTLLVSTIVPSSYPATASRIGAYNAAIPRVVAARRAAGKHVSLVDMALVTTADLDDALHPNDSGYRKMAEAFWAGVQTVSNAGWITAPVGGDGSGSPVKGWLPQNTIASGTLGVGSSPGALVLSGGDQVQFGDVNGDGRADYLVSHVDGSVNVWVNGGLGTDGTIAWISHGSSGFPYAPGFLWQVTDIDGDGKADLAQLDPTTGSLGVYRNAGTDAQGHYVWNSLGQIAGGVGSPGSQIRLADINSDGKADYLDVAPNGSVKAWINGGRNLQGWVWSAQGQIAGGVGSPGSQIRLVDINSDERADYLDVAPNGSVKAWINAGPSSGGGDWLWNPLGSIAAGVGSPSSQIRFADIEGDGMADYLDVSASSGSTREWKNGGGQAQTGTWQWYAQGTITSGSDSRIIYADINGDGKADYLQVDANSSVKAWLNHGPSSGGGDWGWAPQGTIASGVGTVGGNVRFADINGDGKADYLQVEPNSSVKAWLNHGPSSGGGDWGWAPQGTIASGVGVPGNQIRFADINGDRKADYIDVEANSSVKAWLNSGPSSGGGDWGWLPQGTIASGVGVPGSQIRFAPVYGSGRADYLAVADTSAVKVWQNGGPSSGSGDWLWFSGGEVASGVGSSGNRIQFADITGDGRADYLDVNPLTGLTKAWLNVG
ncbi:FG-GAP-like repeat-containing protein [Streptomyces sp. NPDC055210]